MNVFNDVACLPRYREALETRAKPDAVVDLRLAAAEADAVLLVTSYRGRIPSMAHNAIDWLTRRWRPVHCMTSRLPWSADRRVLQRRLVTPSRGRPWRFGTPSDRATDGADPARRGQKLADEVHGGSAAAAMPLRDR